MQSEIEGVRAQIGQTVLREQQLLRELGEIRGTRRNLLERLNSNLPEGLAPITPIGIWQRRQQAQIQHQERQPESPALREQAQQAEQPLFKPDHLIFEGKAPIEMYPPGHKYWVELADSMDHR